MNGSRHHTTYIVWVSTLHHACYISIDIHTPYIAYHTAWWTGAGGGASDSITYLEEELAKLKSKMADMYDGGSNAGYSAAYQNMGGMDVVRKMCYVCVCFCVPFCICVFLVYFVFVFFPWVLCVAFFVCVCF